MRPEPAPNAVLLFDETGHAYRLPRAVAETHRLADDEVRALVARAQTVDVDRAEVPAELRREWRETLARSSEVEGQDGVLAGVVLAKLLVIGVRLLLVAWRSAEQRAHEDEVRAALAPEFAETASASQPGASALPCAQCRAPVAQHQAYFSASGNVLCESCHRRQQLAVGTLRAHGVDE